MRSCGIHLRYKTIHYHHVDWMVIIMSHEFLLCSTYRYISWYSHSTHWGRDKIAVISQASFSNAFPLELLSTKEFVSTCSLALNVMTCRHVLSLNICNLHKCYSSCQHGNLCVDMSFIPKCRDISTHIVVDKSTNFREWKCMNFA